MTDVNALIERMYAELGEEDAGGLLCSLESTIRTYEAERASLANEKERLRAELADRDKAVPDAEELCPTCVESLGVELARKCPANPPAHPPRQAVPEAHAFGSGDKVVQCGTYGGKPAVFIRPAELPGKPGEDASREPEDLKALLPGEWVMTFPTMKQAKTVDAALKNLLTAAPARTEGEK